MNPAVMAHSRQLNAQQVPAAKLVGALEYLTREVGAALDAVARLTGLMQTNPSPTVQSQLTAAQAQLSALQLQYAAAQAEATLKGILL